jgi:cytochrome c556
MYLYFGFNDPPALFRQKILINSANRSTLTLKKMVDSAGLIVSMQFLIGATTGSVPCTASNKTKIPTNRIMRMKKIISLFLGLCLTSATNLNVQAQEYEPEDLIEYRHEVMEAIKGHNEAIEAILKGSVPYNAHLEMHMTSLEALLGTVGELFPEGSDFGDTDAKDAVWDNPEKFKQTVDKAQQAFATFKPVVAKGDNRASLDAFKKFGKASCGNCHKSFKKKDDD